MKLTGRGSASLNSIVYWTRAFTSLTVANKGVGGILIPLGGRIMRSKVALTSADVAIPSAVGVNTASEKGMASEGGRLDYIAQGMMRDTADGWGERSR